MKKNVFYQVTMMVMMTVVCVAFNSCGGDDDGGNSSSGGSGTTGSTEYVDPCLDFGCSVAHVKEYMAGSVWQLDGNSNDAVLLYLNEKTSTVITYMFISGLHMVTVTYTGGGEGKANSFKTEIEKRYGVTMTRENDPSDANQYIYYCTVTINQKKVAIMMNCYAQGINILYSLPD